MGTNMRQDPLTLHFSSRVRGENQGMETGVRAQSCPGKQKHGTSGVRAFTAYANHSLSVHSYMWHGEKVVKYINNWHLAGSVF